MDAQSLGSSMPTKKLHHHIVDAVLLLVMVLGAITLITNQAVAAYYESRFYPGVKVASLNIGGLTRLEARYKLEDTAGYYRVPIMLAGKSQLVKPATLGADFDIEATLDQAFSIGHDRWLALAGIFDGYKQGSLRYSFQIDSKKLAEYLHVLQVTTSRAPVDAKIVVSNGTAAIIGEQPGRQINSGQLKQEFQQSLGKLNNDEIVVTSTTVEPTVKAENLHDALTQTSKIISTQVKFTYSNQQYVPSPAEIGGWLVFDQNAKQPRVDTSKIKTYFANIAKKIDVAPVNKKITTQNGVSRVDQEGNNGLALDQDTASNALAKSLEAKQGLTYTLTTKPVPFRTEVNKLISLELGRYIEINLSAQRMWAYQDHNVVYESVLTSGATGAGFATVTGLFDIYSKQRNRYLNGYALGYNYNVFVQYWMPFYKDFGLHDASWRSSFGGTDYYYAGSHGCVNLPLATAAWMYDWAEVGTPVWVHK